MKATKRITIKDIAKLADVSIGSVHCALYDKPGVSDITRQRVKNIADSLGYKANSAAASLKRKTLWVAASFPDSTSKSRYFYKFIWDGIADWFKVQSDLNIELIPLPYCSEFNNQAKDLNALIDKGIVSGLLTTAETDHDGLLAIKRCATNNIPVIMVSNDAPETGRMCCVLPDFNIIGRMMAELITNQIPFDGNILLCAGNLETASHYLIANGFEAFMSDNKKCHTIYKHHPLGLNNAALKKLEDLILSIPNLKACAAVNTQGSLLLGTALDKIGLKNVVAVGNDMFDENIEFLKNSIFTNLINKRPYTQAYTAAKCMTEYLISGHPPQFDTVYIGSEVVFKSSLVMYSDRFTGQML